MEKKDRIGLFLLRILHYSYCRMYLENLEYDKHNQSSLLVSMYQSLEFGACM